MSGPYTYNGGSGGPWYGLCCDGQCYPPKDQPAFALPLSLTGTEPYVLQNCPE